MEQMRQVIVATHNAGKLVEIQRILDGLMDGRQAGIELLSASDLQLSDPVETGTSFEANALLKAEHAARLSGLPALADDSGLIVDVMGAAPGILSARWSGHHGDDQANINLLLGQLNDIPDTARRSRFVCVAALVIPDLPAYAMRGCRTTRRGEMLGRIIHRPRGDEGFGYDPIFLPDDQPDRIQEGDEPLTSAQMRPDEKNAISHRSKALAAILPLLLDWVL